jgi:hypothetical protein
MIAASAVSMAPLLTNPILYLSLQLLVVAIMSNSTATQNPVVPGAFPGMYALHAAMHSAKLVPLAGGRSYPVRSVLQRMR